MHFLPKLEREQRWWRIHAVGIGCLAATTWGVYALGVEPARRGAAEAARLTARLEVSRQRSAELATAEAALDERIADADQIVAALPVRLLPPDRRLERLARLAELADASGLAMDNLEPGDLRSGPRFGTVPIALSGGGPQSELAGFLRSIHETFSDVAVTRLSVTSGGAENVSGDVIFKIELAWYVLQEAPPAQTAAASSPPG